jgi:hypothetical protein
MKLLTRCGVMVKETGQTDLDEPDDEAAAAQRGRRAVAMARSGYRFASK